MNDRKEVKTNFFDKMIRGIEVMGNKLPNPFLLFIILWAVILVLSQLLSGISAVDPATGERVQVVGMLNVEGLTWVLKNMVGNYIKFSPMGTVLVMMIGLGVATASGLLNEAMKKLARVPEQWLVFLVIFVGICGNIASGAASAIVPALAASLFFAAKKDPIFGLCIGFAGVTAGYTANIILTGTDVLLAGVSTTAYQLVDPKGTVDPTVNYYFMIASTVIISIVASFVVNRFMMKKYGQWDEKYEHCQAALEQKEETAAQNQSLINRGLRNALIATVIYWAILFLTIRALIVPAVVPLMMFYFMFVGLTYGVTVNSIKNADDFVKGMENGIKSCLGFLVIAFPISNAIEAFGQSKIASVLAINLAGFCSRRHIEGLLLFIIIILITSLVNLLLVSSTSKWALLAPIFIPFMYYLGYSPAGAQVLYRIGDSCTNIITPLQPFIPLHLAVIRKYDSHAGMGSIFSRTLPLSITFFVTWVCILAVWYVLGLPLGPGGVHFKL